MAKSLLLSPDVPRLPLRPFHTSPGALVLVSRTSTSEPRPASKKPVVEHAMPSSEPARKHCITLPSHPPSSSPESTVQGCRQRLSSPSRPNPTVAPARRVRDDPEPPSHSPTRRLVESANVTIQPARLGDCGYAKRMRYRGRSRDMVDLVGTSAAAGIGAAGM